MTTQTQTRTKSINNIEIINPPSFNHNGTAQVHHRVAFVGAMGHIVLWYEAKEYNLTKASLTRLMELCNSDYYFADVQVGRLGTKAVIYNNFK